MNIICQASKSKICIISLKYLICSYSPLNLSHCLKLQLKLYEENSSWLRTIYSTSLEKKTTRVPSIVFNFFPKRWLCSIFLFSFFSFSCTCMHFWICLCLLVMFLISIKYTLNLRLLIVTRSILHVQECNYKILTLLKFDYPLSSDNIGVIGS